MSTSYVSSKLQQLNADITRIQGKRADIAHSLAQESEKIARATSRMGGTASASTLRSAQQDIERARKAQSALYQKDASEARDLARKQQDLARAQKDLLTEQQKEMKKSQDEIRKGQDLIKKLESDTRRRSLSSLASFGLALNPSAPPQSRQPVQKAYTAFISHAWEDKDEIARPMADALRALDHSIWFDELTLTIGDSLRRKIDHGLASSRFGIVILSPSFFAKGWPQYELDGLVAREVEGTKVILPIWHRITKSEVLSYSPTLADKIALSTAMYTPEEIAQRIHEVLVNSSEINQR